MSVEQVAGRVRNITVVLRGEGQMRYQEGDNQMDREWTQATSKCRLGRDLSTVILNLYFPLPTSSCLRLAVASRSSLNFFLNIASVSRRHTLYSSDKSECNHRAPSFCSTSMRASSVDRLYMPCSTAHLTINAALISYYTLLSDIASLLVR